MNKGSTLIALIIGAVIVIALFLFVYKGAGEDKGVVETKVHAEKEIEKLEKQIEEKNKSINEIQ